MAGRLESTVEHLWTEIESRRDELIGVIADLVRRPSLLGEEGPAQAYVADYLRASRMTTEVWELDQSVRTLPNAGDSGVPFAGRPNVAGTLRGRGGGRSLVLNGHIDVVSPEPSELWSGAPFAARRDGEWVYGRGAGDMKSGLVAMVGAVAGLQRLGLTPRGRVQLQSVVEEECTGHGALACVLAGHTADAAVLTEPTQGAIWPAQVGVLWFKVRVLGAPAHAGEAAEGANAIEASYRVIEALRDLETDLNEVRPPLFAAYPHPINLNVGMIRGGDWPSTVAGECVTHLRLATFPGEPVADLKRRVEEVVAGVQNGRHRIDVLYEGFQCEGYELAEDAPLVQTLSAASTRATGTAPPIFASTATTDARAFALYGDTPAVSFGPVAENEHGVDERVHVPSITRTAQALALFISDWSGLSP